MQATSSSCQSYGVTGSESTTWARKSEIEQESSWSYSLFADGWTEKLARTYRRESSGASAGAWGRQASTYWKALRISYWECLELEGTSRDHLSGKKEKEKKKKLSLLTCLINSKHSWNLLVLKSSSKAIWNSSVYSTSIDWLHPCIRLKKTMICILA